MVGTLRKGTLIPLKAVEIESQATGLDSNFELFRAEMTLTALLAGAAITGLTAAKVNGRTVKINHIVGVVTGGVPWAVTGTYIQVQQTDGTNVLRIPIATLVANAILNLNSANAVLGTAFRSNFGKLVAGQGLQLAGDANFGSGSDIQFTITGWME